MAIEYYQSLDDPETILLIDSWESQEAIDICSDIDRWREKKAREEE